MMTDLKKFVFYKSTQVKIILNIGKSQNNCKNYAWKGNGKKINQREEVNFVESAFYLKNWNRNRHGVKRTCSAINDMPPWLAIS